MDCEPDGQNSGLEKTPRQGENATPLGGDPGGCGKEHGLRGRTCPDGEHQAEPRTHRATRYLETAFGVLNYSELAPLLAARVAAAESCIVSGHYHNHPLDDVLVLDLHRSICGDIVPDWAGKWRIAEVRVGNLKPAPPHMVAQQMRDYSLDLRARLDYLEPDNIHHLMESLAFAEGRFLTIHPFLDFNGRFCN